MVYRQYRQLLNFGLGGLLGMGAIATFATPILSVTQQVNLTIQGDQAQQYSSLIDEAVELANASVNQAFTQAEADDVDLTVMVNRRGQILPILALQVTRAQWQQQPDVYAWAQHSFSNSVLLGMASPSSYGSRPQRANAELTNAQQQLIVRTGTADRYD